MHGQRKSSVRPQAGTGSPEPVCGSSFSEGSSAGWRAWQFPAGRPVVAPGSHVRCLEGLSVRTGAGARSVVFAPAVEPHRGCRGGQQRVRDSCTVHGAGGAINGCAGSGIWHDRTEPCTRRRTSLACSHPSPTSSGTEPVTVRSHTCSAAARPRPDVSHCPHGHGPVESDVDGQTAGSARPAVPGGVAGARTRRLTWGSTGSRRGSFFRW